MKQHADIIHYSFWVGVPIFFFRAPTHFQYWYAPRHFRTIYLTPHLKLKGGHYDIMKTEQVILVLQTITVIKFHKKYDLRFSLLSSRGGSCWLKSSILLPGSMSRAGSPWWQCSLPPSSRFSRC